MLYRFELQNIPTLAYDSPDYRRVTKEESVLADLVAILHVSADDAGQEAEQAQLNVSRPKADLGAVLQDFLKIKNVGITGIFKLAGSFYVQILNIL